MRYRMALASERWMVLVPYTRSPIRSAPGPLRTSVSILETLSDGASPISTRLLATGEPFQTTAKALCILMEMLQGSEILLSLLLHPLLSLLLLLQLRTSYPSPPLRRLRHQAPRLR